MHIISIVLAGLLLVSCGGGGGGGAEPTSSTPDRQPQNPNTPPPGDGDGDGRGGGDVGLDQFTVNCSGVFDCPEYVAQIGISTYSMTGVCSGTLIAPDKVLTNSHCIPPGLQSAGADCMGDIVVTFPSAGTKNTEKAYCSKVVMAYDVSDTTGTAPDIAVIQLDRQVNRQIVPNTFVKGLQGNQTAHAFVVDPSGGAHGEVRRVDCETHVNNVYVAPTNGDNLSELSLITGDDCLVIKGNSGTGLYNETGALAGAIFATIDTDGLNRSRGQLKYDLTTYHGMAVSLSCLPDYYSDSPRSKPQCIQFASGGSNSNHLSNLMLNAAKQAAQSHSSGVTGEQIYDSIDFRGRSINFGPIFHGGATYRASMKVVDNFLFDIELKSATSWSFSPTSASAASEMRQAEVGGAQESLLRDLQSHIKLL